MLEDHKFTLTRDIAMLDNMYQLNIQNFRQLSMYIAAGKKKLEEARTVQLAQLQAKAQSTGLHEDAQAANDFAEFCNRFEKKLYDLELTRTVSLQMAPQIRLVQNNDTMMVEKINSTLVNTIPLWKNQMVLSLGIANSQQAIKAQRAVTDVTNELLRKNSEMLKMNTVAVAQESERGNASENKRRPYRNSRFCQTDTGGRLTEASRCRGRAHTHRKRAQKQAA